MIRPYTPANKEYLTEAFAQNIPLNFAEHELAEFCTYLDAYAGTYLVIEHEGNVIGGLGYEVQEADRSGRINWMFIHPGFTGKGYGKEAALYCINQLKQDHRVERLVVRTSQLAFPFFKKLGYQLRYTEKNYRSVQM